MSLSERTDTSGRRCRALGHLPALWGRWYLCSDCRRFVDPGTFDGVREGAVTPVASPTVDELLGAHPLTVVPSRGIGDPTTG